MPPASPAAPAAPSVNGLAARAPAVTGVGISPNGAPGVPGVAQGTIAPPVTANPAQQFNPQGMMQNIANYYQIPKQTALAQAGVEGNKFNATTAYEGKLQEESQFAKEQLDPTAYKVIQGPSGVTILDPVTGNQVSNGQYVSRTGSEGLNTLMDALKASPNARDQQFVSDYNNFQTYINAAVSAKYNANGSPANEAAKIVQSYQADNKSLQNLTPQQAATQFNAEYGDYLGIPQTGPTPTQAVNTPALSQDMLNYLIEHQLWTGNSPPGATSGSLLDLSGITGLGSPASTGTAAQNASQAISSAIAQNGG